MLLEAYTNFNYNDFLSNLEHFKPELKEFILIQNITNLFQT